MSRCFTGEDRIAGVLVRFVIDTSTGEFYLTLPSVVELAGLDNIVDIYRLSHNDKYLKYFDDPLIDTLDAVVIGEEDVLTLEVLPVEDAISVIFWEYWTNQDGDALDTITEIEELSDITNALHTYMQLPYGDEELDILEGYLEGEFNEAIIRVGEDPDYAG